MAGLRIPEAEESSGALCVPALHPSPHHRRPLAQHFSVVPGMFFSDFSVSLFPSGCSLPHGPPPPPWSWEAFPFLKRWHCIVNTAPEFACMPSDPSSPVGRVTLSMVSDLSVPWLSPL